MFYPDGIIMRSSVLESPKTAHGFSTRLGGVSTHPYTREMNLAKGREDSDEIVTENINIFVKAVSSGKYSSSDAVCAGQIHSKKVRYITHANKGEGITKDAGEECDGFVTDERGVMPVIRVADCVPILLCASKDDSSPIIGAVHAGWRGTVNGIAYEAITEMQKLGADMSTLKAAIGAHISSCCFTVGEDFCAAVKDIRGENFAKRHIFLSESAYHADLAGMNVEILKECGVGENNIDICGDCTACSPELFHSHRKTGGKRGAMGAGIVIL